MGEFDENQYDSLNYHSFSVAAYLNILIDKFMRSVANRAEFSNSRLRI